MKRGVFPSRLWFVLGWPLVSATVLAQSPLQVLPDKAPQVVFGGGARTISVIWHNSSNAPVQAEIRARLYQASSATAMPLGDTPWKKLQVLAGQTVLESATLHFPAVKTETRFLVQWLEGTAKLLGLTEVLVYPLDLLKELKPLAGEEPLGFFDPQDQLKPLLKLVGVEFQNLENSRIEDFPGKLAVIGPFQCRGQMPEGLANRIKALASKGVAVVWIQPPPERLPELKPSFYMVLQGKGAVVVVQAELMTDLPDSPKAQLNLVQLARLALHPEPARLPDLTAQQ